MPSGLNATLRNPSCRHRLADRLAGLGIPQPHGAVPTAGDDPVPVGAERHAEHLGRVAGQRGADGLAGGRVPHPHGAVWVAPAGDDPLAVGAERHT